MVEEREAPLDVSFDGVRDKNVQQLRTLNRCIFPVRYQVRGPALLARRGTRGGGEGLRAWNRMRWK